MPKNTKNNPQPLPEEILAEVQNMPEETVVSITNKTGKRVNALAAHNAVITEAVQNKVQLLEQAEKAIHKVVELAGNKEAAATEAGNIAEASADAALLLFRGRTTGLLSNDEASEMLGRAFGFKVKQNGEDSKTPFGQGEVIRKRVVRAVDAWSFVNSNAEPKAFFEPLSRDDVKPLLNEVIAGKRSILTFYNDLSEMKAEATGNRPKPAFDPKRILALHGTLAENVSASVATWHDTPGLFEAYAGLFRIINTIAEEYSVAYPDEIAA